MTEQTGQGSAQDARETGPRPRSFAALLVLAVSAALLFAGFVALGTWQVQRLHWKRALIERVEQRVHADPVSAPGRDRWPFITAESDEYRHVRISGTYLHHLSTLVQAATELGSGYWLITPLRDAGGNVVLINRGYISAQAAGRIRQQLRSGSGIGADAQPGGDGGPVVVTGLLRMSEPGGGFLRDNDPIHDKWYSRDIQAIAAARGLSGVAPYFIDADATSPEKVKSAAGSSDGPIGGLTVISFHNNHMTYALTWYALALMVAGASLWVAREEYRNRRGIRPHPDGAGRKSADGRDD
jgi:surfeit locus 1 family protein